MAGGAIIGTINDTKGKPLKGVSILLKGKNFNPSIPIDALFNIPPEQGKKALSKSNGQFKIGHIRAGIYSLKISSKNLSNKVMKDIQIQEGQNLDLGLIQIPLGGLVKGCAYDEKGLPAKGVQITASSLTAGDRKTATTNNKGYYEITNLSPGEYVLSMTPKNLWDAFKYDSSVNIQVKDEQTVLANIVTRLADKNKKK